MADDNSTIWLPKSKFGIKPPWLLIACKPKSIIRLDVGMLDRLEIEDGQNLLLVVDDLEVSIPVADGDSAAMQCVDRLSPFSRNGLLNNTDALRDAKLRLESMLNSNGDIRTGWLGGLIVGEHVVAVRGDEIQIGDLYFKISKVKKLARKAANIELPDGAKLQAALALLVVAATEFRTAGEEVAKLRRRIETAESH